MRDFDILEWDSRTFGFKVARIRQPTHELDSLHNCLLELRGEQVALAYWFAADDPEMTRIAEQCQGKLIDRKATYSMDLAMLPAPALSWQPQIQDAHGSDLAALESLAIQTGQFSRFARDPRFPRALFELLYREWIKKSVEGTLADRVLIWREDDRPPHGLITLSIRSQAASIGLFGVAAESRGRGIGRHLIQAALAYATECGAPRCDVVTQQDNLTACSMYEANGFRLRSVQRVHHIWPAESP